MPSPITAFILQLAQARKNLNRVTSPQLHSQKRRDSLRGLVEDYFNNIRPSLISASEQDQEVGNVDNLMQELLVLCHKHGSVKRYQTLLSKARKALIGLDARLVVFPIGSEGLGSDNSVDTMIIETLEQIVPSAALSYKQALQDLQTDERYSWGGPATDL